MNLTFVLLSLLFALSASSVWSAENGKIGVTGGFFALSAKAGENSTSVSSPSAFRVSYQYPVLEKFEVAAGYSILLADLSGSDLGYGLDLGANYFPFSKSTEDRVKTPVFSVTRYETYAPYVGVGFYQRQFQSVKNSYAGLGFCAGTEKYFSEKFNLKLEGRMVQLGGSGESTATETSILAGVVFKL